MKLKASGKNNAARAMFNDTFDRHTIDYVSHLKQMLTMQERAIDGQAKQIGNDADRAKVPLSLVCAVMVAVSTASAALFFRALFRRLGGKPATAAVIVAEIA